MGLFDFFKNEGKGTQKLLTLEECIVKMFSSSGAENGGYPPTQHGDICSLFWLFGLMVLQN